MKTLAETFESIQQLAIDNNYRIENASSIIESDTKWLNAVSRVAKTPSEISEAIAYVDGIPGMLKIRRETFDGSMTKYSKIVDGGYEFIMEIQKHSKKGVVRALITLYDNLNAVCAYRNMLKTDSLNSL